MCCVLHYYLRHVSSFKPRSDVTFFPPPPPPAPSATLPPFHNVCPSLEVFFHLLDQNVMHTPLQLPLVVSPSHNQPSLHHPITTNPPHHTNLTHTLILTSIRFQNQILPSSAPHPYLGIDHITHHTSPHRY